MNLDILLSCCKAGQKKKGTENSPVVLLTKLRDVILKSKLDININNRWINCDEFDNGDGYKNLYHYGIMTNNNLLNFGGDHSIGLSTVLSSLYKYKRNLKVIWVDAHADLNTYESSVSKNTHGMPLSPTLKLMKPWFDIKKDQYFMDPSQLVYIGLRSVDPPEKEFIDKLGIKVYYSTDVITLGIEKIMAEIMESDKNETIYHLSFDIDGLDPEFMPSTGTAEDQGLSLNDGQYIIKTLMKTKRMKVFDLVELNLNIGTIQEQYKTADNCSVLLEEYIKGLF